MGMTRSFKRQLPLFVLVGGAFALIATYRVWEEAVESLCVATFGEGGVSVIAPIVAMIVAALVLALFTGWCFKYAIKLYGEELLKSSVKTPKRLTRRQINQTIEKAKRACQYIDDHRPYGLTRDEVKERFLVVRDELLPVMKQDDITIWNLLSGLLKQVEERPGIEMYVEFTARTLSILNNYNKKIVYTPPPMSPSCKRFMEAMQAIERESEASIIGLDASGSPPPPSTSAGRYYGVHGYLYI
jgi:hypothetical protein